MISDYSGLKASLADWMHRGDLNLRIPDFIRLAEARFNRMLRVRQMEESRWTADVDGIVKLPDDWLELIDAPRCDGEPLEFVTRDQYRALRKRDHVGAYYTIFGDSLGIGYQDVDVEFDYYARIPNLSEDEPKNWLLLEAPDAYLYGSLLEAEPYIKNDPRTATWKAFLEVALNDIQGASDRSRFSGPMVIR